MSDEKSLDKETILEKLQGLMKAPKSDNPKEVKKFNDAKITLEGIKAEHEKAKQAKGKFAKAMDVANPDGKHKKEVWAKNPKKKAQIIEDDNTDSVANDILKAIQRKKAAAKKKAQASSAGGGNVIIKGGDAPGQQIPGNAIATAEIENEVVGSVEDPNELWKRYILIKGIPLPEKSDDPRLWLKVYHGANEYYFDEVEKENIVIEFEEDPAEFPLKLKIELWYGDLPELRFERYGIFPKDPSVKRVSTDLSSRGRKVKGVTDGSQESIKRFLKRIEEKREEQEPEDDPFTLHSSAGGLGGTAVSAGPFIGSAIMSCSAIGPMTISATAMNNSITIDPPLTEDSDLTETMEESIEKLIKTAVEEAKDEVRNNMLEDLKKEIYQDITGGAVPLPPPVKSPGTMDPDFQNISNNTQIYSNYDLEQALTKIIKKQREKDQGTMPTEPFSVRDISDLGSLVSSTGVMEWEAEERLEDFLKKVIKDETDDHGGLG